MNGEEVDQTFAKAKRYDRIIDTVTTFVEVLVILAIFMAGVAVGYYLLMPASAAYAGDCLTLNYDADYITNISVTPIDAPTIESLDEWTSAQCIFTLDNGTLRSSGNHIEPASVTLCTHPLLAPGIYEIAVITWKGDVREEHKYHYGGGGGSGGDSSDKDGDGIPDDIEWTMCTDWEDPDTDDDGLNDFEEIVAGEDGWITDPCDADTDGDGVNDRDDAYPLDPSGWRRGGGSVTVTPAPTEIPGNATAPVTPPANPTTPVVNWYMVIAAIFLILITLAVIYAQMQRERSKKSAMNFPDL